MKVIVSGGGSHGSYVAAQLVEAGHQVTVIEIDSRVTGGTDPEHADSSSGMAALTWVTGDACDPEVCEDAGVPEADALVALTGDDAGNLVIAQLAKSEFRVQTVVARVNHPENRWLFDDSWGVDVAISSHDVISQVISEEVALGDVVALLRATKGDFSVVELELSASSPAIGRALSDLGLPPGCLVVTVLRDGQATVPAADFTFADGDEVVAVTDPGSQSALKAMMIGVQR